MSTTAGLSSGTASLRQAAVDYFSGIYQSPAMILDGELDPALKWQPSFHFKVNDHLTVAVEASETTYPLVFSLRRVDLEQLPFPISVYCVCPEQAYLDDQAEAKRLMAHGYGLLTVDAQGLVQRRSGCIPIVQQIPEREFKEDIKELPVKLRQRLAESFERYQQNAPSGVADVAEVMEGLVVKASREAVKKGWIPANVTRTPASALIAMSGAAQAKNAAAAIGSAQGFISHWRNVSHHFPKNKKAAAKKYRECRHAFLDGVKQARFFRGGMKNIGLSGNL